MQEVKYTKYLQFPLSQIREMFYNQKTVMNDIMDVGICRFAQKLPCDILDVCRPLLYDFCRHPEKLPTTLKKQVKGFINQELIGTLDDVNFDQELIGSEAASMADQFTKDAPELLPLVYDYSRVHKAMGTLGIKGNTGSILEHGRQIAAAALPGEPWPMISKNLAFEFRDNEKTEFDLAQLAGYIGIRSILGKKPYCKTNKNMILARMFGYSTFMQLQTADTDSYTYDLVKKYSSRYWMGKVLQALELNWKILIEGKGLRGLYVGQGNKIELGSFILAVETRKQRRKINELKQRKEEARESALQQLNKEHPLNKAVTWNQ